MKNSPQISHSRFKQLLDEERLEALNRVYVKRRGDLILIESLNWRNENGLHALEIFPKEVWLQIFNLLETPSHLESTRRTCLLFRNLLEERYLTDILFPQVLAIPHFQRCLYPYRGPTRENPVQQKSKPSEILKLRLICKSWRRSVDLFFEAKLDRLRSSLDEPDVRNEPFPHPSLCIEGPIYYREARDLLPKIISDFGGTPAKKFISRSLTVKMKQFPLIPNYHYNAGLFNQSVIELLELIGDQIWHFHFSVQCMRETLLLGLTLTDVYLMLQGWACLMPNLKLLMLHWPESRRIGFLEEPQDTLRRAFKSSPFEHFERLESLRLSFGLVGRVPLVFHQILSCNRHIKHLEINGPLLWPDVPPFLDSLRNLQLESISISSRDEIPMRILHNFASSWCGLKSIRLQCLAAEISTLELLTFLETFEALERVEVEGLGPREGLDLDGGGYPLNLMRRKEIMRYRFNENQTRPGFPRCDPATWNYLGQRVRRGLRDPMVLVWRQCCSWIGKEIRLRRDQFMQCGCWNRTGDDVGAEIQYFKIHPPAN